MPLKGCGRIEGCSRMLRREERRTSGFIRKSFFLSGRKRKTYFSAGKVCSSVLIPRLSMMVMTRPRMLFSVVR